MEGEAAAAARLGLCSWLAVCCARRDSCRYFVVVESESEFVKTVVQVRRAQSSVAAPAVESVAEVK